MNLTAKELEVVELLASGMVPKEIRERLKLSVGGYTHRRISILNKLGAMNDAQLGVLVERHQLVPVDQRNKIEDRREERLDARRSNGGHSLEEFRRRQSSP